MKLWENTYNFNITMHIHVSGHVALELSLSLLVMALFLSNFGRFFADPGLCYMQICVLETSLDLIG